MPPEPHRYEFGRPSHRSTVRAGDPPMAFYVLGLFAGYAAEDMQQGCCRAWASGFLAGSTLRLSMAIARFRAFKG